MRQFSLDNFLSGGNTQSKQQTQTSRKQVPENTINTNPHSENLNKAEAIFQQPSKSLKSQIIEDDSSDITSKQIKYDNSSKTQHSKASLKEQTKQTPSSNSSIEFKSVVSTWIKIEECKGERSKDIIKDHFANLFIDIYENYPSDLPRLYYFLLSKVGPEYKSPEFGIGNGIWERIVGKVIGVSEKQIKEKLIELGDLAWVAEQGKKKVKTMDKFSNFIVTGPQKNWSLQQVLTTFTEIANKKGKSSTEEKSKLLCKIMFQASSEEVKYLVRSLQKSLKIGASFKTIIFSFARAISKLIKNKLDEKTISSILLMSINQWSDEDIVFQHIISLITSKEDFRNLTLLCKIRPGIPVNPQLARPTNGISVIFNRFEKIPFTCEYKYDGFRGQIHFNNGKTQIFSRNLEEMTETYPDIVEYVNNFQKVSNEKQAITSFIIDCEMVAFDTVKSKILPFQQLTTRSRKNVDISTITVRVCMFVFDILLWNDEIVTNKTLRERRELLYGTFTENEYIQFAKHLSSEDQQEIETFMTDSITSGCEGLIVKAIDVNSEYMPGQRNFNWLKLKKDYLDTSIGDSIDLVVIGALHGKGKRVGMYGTFLWACYNDDNETYESVSMTGGGLKDEDLSNFYQQLKEFVIPNPMPNYRIGDVTADVFFKPSMVWEIKTADLTQSPIYTAGHNLTPDKRGISLRFPRFIRIRPDKKPEEAVTSEEIVKLYNNQAFIGDKGLSEKYDDLDDLY